MSLAASQAAFQTWLQQADDAGIAPALVDPRGLSVYQNNYRASLMACLSEAFPHTRAWLGAEAFEGAAARHIDAHPPASFTLDAYPEGFVETLRAIWPDDGEVAELAGLEWHLSDCFVAGDDVPLLPGDLAGLDWDRTGLRLVASARVLPFASNAPAIWSALARGEYPPGAEFGDQPAAFIVWRADFICCFREIQGVEAQLLPLLAQPQLFGDLCADLARAHGEDEAIRMAGDLLARWMADGLVVGETLAGPVSGQPG